MLKMLHFHANKDQCDVNEPHIHMHKAVNKLPFVQKCFIKSQI